MSHCASRVPVQVTRQSTLSSKAINESVAAGHGKPTSMLSVRGLDQKTLEAHIRKVRRLPAVPSLGFASRDLDLTA
jgi:hypothetical protein